MYKNVLTDSLLHLNTACGLITSVSNFFPPLLCETHFDSGHLKPHLNKGQSSGGGGGEGGVYTHTLLIRGAKVKFKVQCGNPGDDSATFHQVAQLLFNHQCNILAQIHRVLRREGEGDTEQI